MNENRFSIPKIIQINYFQSCGWLIQRTLFTNSNEKCFALWIRLNIFGVRCLIRTFRFRINNQFWCSRCRFEAVWQFSFNGFHVLFIIVVENSRNFFPDFVMNKILRKKVGNVFFSSLSIARRYANGWDFSRYGHASRRECTFQLI